MSVRRDLSTYTDVPISRPEDDRLDRAEFAAHVARRIEAASGGPSVVFGLAGPWGGGKSSVLNMIQLGVESTAPGWKVQRFTPWAASDTATLVAEFYATINAALPEKTRRKAKKALASFLAVGAQGATLIPTVGNAASGALKSAADYLDKVKPFDEQFVELSKDLQDGGIKILVIVDDLDRLDANELLAVLKTVRLLGSFPGIHYLLSYDQDTICDVLSQTAVAKNKPQRALEYLEKIVQYPFEVPPLQAVHRDREIEELLKAIAERDGINIEPSSPGRTSPVWFFLNQIPDTDLVTLRSIHRLINQFDVVLTTIGPNEVNFLDLLLLTFLRMEYPTLYENIKRWKADITKPKHHLVFMNSRTEKNINWGERVMTALKDVSDSMVREKLYGLVRFLFPAVLDADGRPGFSRSDSDYRHVCEQDYFDRYFNFTVPVSDISDAAVVAGLTSIGVEGALADDTQLAAAFNDARRRIAINKSRNLIPQVHFSCQTALKGAEFLTSKFGLDRDPQPIWSMEARLVADLLAISISRATEDNEALEAVDAYHQRYGLRLTTMVIGSIERNSEIAFTPERFKAALQNHRSRQFESCLKDLAEEDRPDSGGILFHWNMMDGATKDRLSEHARAAVATWDDFVSVGMCFLGEPSLNANNVQVIGRFYLDDLNELLPTELWPAPPPGIDTSTPIDLRDLSYENRVRAVGQVLAQHAPDPNAP
ncbi:hypothetical protein IU450_34135 [Nocardia abscessus]|uniref:KAP family P-loop NTPase fold protein n=1 Tax=Nocardia abscessus TaxID=120957 RepID=UPI00189547C0|nr:P-loop NTPase fold protein [Nocardia abscessus]MBF6340893.1 hypothetical protein [Nocardia abscessus]